MTLKLSEKLLVDILMLNHQFGDFIMRLYVFGLCAFLFCGSVLADSKLNSSSSGFYLGASWVVTTFGANDVEEDLDNALAVATFAVDPTLITSVDIDENDHGWKIYTGYNFNQYIGIEGGYYDLGDVGIEQDIVDPASPIFLRATTSGEVDALALFGTARYSRNGFTMFVKGGLARVEYDISDVGVDDDDIVAAVGAGFIWSGKYPLGIRVEFEYFDEVEEIDATLVSLGLQYNF